MPTKMIDVHTHGMGGYDTTATLMEHILRIAELHGAAGVSEILLSIYPGPIDVMRRQMGIVRQAMEKQGRGARGEEQGGKAPSGSRSARSLRGAARILGVHLEGPFLNPTRSGALDPRSFVMPAEKRFRELVEGLEDVVKVITVAPELNGAGSLIRKIVSRGIIVSMGHSDATYAEAEAGWKAGAQGITHLFNAMRGFHHREPGIAGFGLLNRDIYVEVIADPFHLHARTIEFIFKVKNSERIILVSDSVKETGTKTVKHGAVNASHVLQGGRLSLPESCRRLITQGFDATVIAHATTVNPRRYLGTRQ